MPADRLSLPVTVGAGGFAACPTSNTAISSKDTVVYSLIVVNASAGALTITITDNASSPLTIFNAVSLAANGGTLSFNPQGGIVFSGGIKMLASGAGLVYGINAERAA